MELNQVQSTLARTSAAASAAASILQGPQNYLLLTGNNAEMRSGSGAFLEAGIVTTAGGQLHLTGMQPTTSLTVPVGGVPVGGDLKARWGWLLPGVDWRNLGLTPQFDINGALAARMWKFKTGQQVDGVMQLDVGGLRELLTVTGPVTTATGLVVSADNVDQLLLHDQYIGEGYSDYKTQAARVDQLGSLATAMMHALETRPLDLHAMVNALSAETSGRHIMLWSANPDTESVWRATGVSGQLTSTSLVSGLINRGGNKLDQYITMSSQLDLVTHGKRTAATMTVSLSNHTPAGQSAYIAGPYIGSNLHYGEYLGIVSVNLPNDVRNLEVGTKENVVVNGQEGPTLLVGISVDLLPGASRKITLNFSLPQSHGRLTVMSSARIPPETWNVNGQVFTDASTRTVSW
jgi:hypothetical protein